ncbi:MAG TPA: hypothetical protein VE617_11310 [Propionibacteriaceae bacterium]|nr:hypothetical protein [Propionibacteriaceae bacterium]
MHPNPGAGNRLVRPDPLATDELVGDPVCRPGPVRMFTVVVAATIPVVAAEAVGT